MASKSSIHGLLATALLLALALVGLDVVDSARTVVVVGGYLWVFAFSAAALLVVLRTLRARHAH